MKDLLTYFKEVKKRNNVVVYDTHVHPFEVIGVCDNSMVTHGPKGVTVPSLLEKLDFNFTSLFILEKLFLLAPKYIHKTVRKTFSFDNFNNLKNELSISGVDKCVVVPVAPCASTNILQKYAESEQFVVLGTIDVHGIDINDIEKELLRQKSEYGIKGIKLHPNIQKFYPIPSRNNKDLEKKLTRLYEIINKLNLYVLFHAGISYLPTASRFEKVSYAVLENFFNEDGALFERFSVPIVLAHMGSYNIYTPNVDLLGNILDKYTNVYFDTAGVNSKIIQQLINNDRSKKIIFGSDARYFDIKYSVYRILRALQKSSYGLNDDFVVRIFSQNYLDLLKKIL